MKVARYRSVVTSIDSAIGKVWQGKYLAEELEELWKHSGTESIKELKKLPIPTAAPAFPKLAKKGSGIPA